MKIKGVNLGNWLVLEKWMNPALFEGTTAEDEYYLPRQLSPEVYEARIKIHRSEYITERDFVTIKKMSLESVRIPVPYFIFGDRKPFIGCIEELDKAFNWAEKYGLTILIDLHTVPMSQNGFDNGGLSGVVNGHRIQMKSNLHSVYWSDWQSVMEQEKVFWESSRLTSQSQKICGKLWISNIVIQRQTRFLHGGLHRSRWIFSENTILMPMTASANICRRKSMWSFTMDLN